MIEKKTPWGYKVSAIVLAGIALVLAYRIVQEPSAAPAQAPLSPPGPNAPHFTTPPERQIHDTGGPYIGLDQASGVALSVSRDPAAAKIKGATMATVAQASLGRASRVVTAEIADDRMIWTVSVDGLYVPSFWSPRAGTPPTATTYFVVIDAATGTILGTGSDDPVLR